MKVPYVDIAGQHRALKKNLLRELGVIIDRSDFVLGQAVGDLEKRFADYCGTRYAIGVNSGTDALFLSMKALGVGKDDEVITASNSFLATASSIIATGAKPVFIDVRDDFNINPALIEEKITKNTKAILPVHLTGKAADMTPILKIAKKHNLFVIEDAAQAIGTEYRNRRAGSLGTVGCFSLHPLKTLNACGDGGVITTNDENLYQKLIQLRNIGLKNRIEADLWGYNSRLDSLQAATVNSKFDHLDQWLAKRRGNADYYRRHLAKIVRCPEEPQDEKHAYHLFMIQTNQRDKLQEYLLKNGIETKIHYPIPIHLQKCAGHLGYKTGSLPNTEKQARTILSLPIYQTLHPTQLEYVVEKVSRFFS